jgi:hypothetical protein
MARVDGFAPAAGPSESNERPSSIHRSVMIQSACMREIRARCAGPNCRPWKGSALLIPSIRECLSQERCMCPTFTEIAPRGKVPFFMASEGMCRTRLASIDVSNGCRQPAASAQLHAPGLRFLSPMRRRARPQCWELPPSAMDPGRVRTQTCCGAVEW